MLQRPKGTVDLFGSKGRLYNNIEMYTYDYMKLNNFEYIKVPTFESSNLFKRGVGEGTDIVNKETYDFIDKGGREMTLRPEFTAGVVRSYIENKEYSFNRLKKYYYFGSCFRYERPQNGRLREFTQFGVEVIGAKNPRLDSDLIYMAYKYLEGLGIKNLKVKINTLGDNESRNKYKEILKEYISKDYDNLCDLCKDRYFRNPLRILDCKYDGNRDYIKNAPKTIDYLNEESINYFNSVKESLTELGIDYEVDTTLVRGLDYYTHTVFEIVSSDESLSLASTICGGGRYDNLVGMLDGPSTPAVGFAIGIERIVAALECDEDSKFYNSIDVYIMNLTDDVFAYKLNNDLRNNGYISDICYENKNMKQQWKLVDEINPNFVVIVGEDELAGGYVTIKDNKTKEQVSIKNDEVIDYFNTYY